MPEQHAIPPNELELLMAAKAGDSDAFQELVTRHDERLRQWVKTHVVPRSDADDVVQDVYERAWRGIGRLRGPRFWPWLIGIARHVSAAYFRRRPPKPGPTPGQKSPRKATDPWLAVEDSIDLHALLAALEPAERQVLLLRAWGFSYRDVARHLGKSQTACRKLHTRALSRCRELMHRD
jgi:RNA polymerase sigma-70 factor (ECF subfamily)